MKKVLWLFILSLSAMSSWATTYYSVPGSTDPNVLTNWKTNRDGTGSSPSGFTTSGDIFIIQGTGNGVGTPVSMTTSAAWTVTSGSSSKLIIENGATLQGDHTITISSTATFQIDNGGKYIHNNTNAYGSGILNGIESFGASSTFEINKSNTTGPSAVFGNLIINLTADPGGVIQCSGNITTINGNLEVKNTDIREFRLSAGTSLTLTIGGNLMISGGVLEFASSAGSSNTRVLNLAGNYTQTGGTFKCTGSSNPLTLNFTGTGKTFTKSSGILTNTNINWDVNGGASLTLNNDLPVASSRTMTVNGSLACASNLVTGSGTFTLSDGATLKIGSSNGIASSGSTGNIQTTSRNFSSTANYEYSGSSSQVTGTGLPSSVNDLAVNNTNGLTLTSDVIVNGTLYLTSGVIDAVTNNKILSIGSSGSYSGGSSSSHINGKLARGFSSIGSKTFPIGKGGNYRPLSINYSVLTGTSTITAEQFESTLPGTMPGFVTLFGSRYWTVTESGGSAFVYSITLDGTGFSPSGNPKILKKDGSDPVAYPAVPSGNNYTAEGLTSFSDFALGDEVICPATKYDVTGGGSYCSGGTGVVVGLSGSQAGISYQLKKDGTDVGSPVEGTGSAISFGDQTAAGTYTVAGIFTPTSCSTDMNGSTDVIINTPVTWYRDADNDTYGDAGTTTTTCDGSQPAGYVSDNTDCDDTDDTIHPNATEVCDGKDNNCDGTIDEGCSTPIILPPSGTISGNQTICAGNTAALTFSVIGSGTAIVTYGDSQAGVFTVTGATDGSAFTATTDPLSAGTYTFTIISIDDSNGSATGTGDATVIVSTCVDIAVTKIADPIVLDDEDLEYTITVENISGLDAGIVTVTDVLPANTTFVNASSADAALSFDGTTLTAQVNSLSAGSTFDVTLIVHVNAGTPSGTILSNTATVTTGGDTDASNNASTAITTVLPHPFASISGDQSICYGSCATLTFNVTGFGTITVTYFDSEGGVYTIEGTQGQSPLIATICSLSGGTHTFTIAYVEDEVCFTIGGPGAPTVNVNGPQLSADINGVAVDASNNGFSDEDASLSVCSGTDNIQYGTFSDQNNLGPQVKILQTVQTTNVSTSICNGCKNTLTTFSGQLHSATLVDPSLGGILTVTFRPWSDDNLDNIIDANECSGDPIVYTIYVNRLPSATMSGGGSVCLNGTPPPVYLTGADGPSPFIFSYRTSGTVTSTTSVAGTSTGTIITPTDFATTYVYYLESVQDANGCIAAAAGVATVVINPLPPAPVITPAGTVTICTNSFVELTSSYSSGNQWYVDGNAISGATGNVYTATTAGNYSVEITSAGCTSTSTATTVTVTTIATPIITASGPTSFCSGGIVTLTSSAASGNQWFLNGSAIAGATGQALTVTTSGDYLVTVIEGGCSTASSIVHVSVNSGLIPAINGCIGNVIPFTITENSGTTLSNYQVRLVVNTQTLVAGGYMNVTGKDIRFSTGSSGTGQLAYWIDQPTMNTPTTNIWVRLNTLPANSNLTIYMSFGNATLSAESTLSIFDGPFSSTDQVSSGGPGGVGNSQRGFRFSPNEDILVAQFGKREPTGTTRYVTIFNFTTTAIVNQMQVSGPAGVYNYSNVANPFWLTSGTQYLLELYQGISDGYYFGGSSQINSHLTYYDMRYCNSCNQNTFPTNVLANNHYGYPDFKFYVRKHASVEPAYVEGSMSNPCTITACSNTGIILDAGLYNTYTWSTGAGTRTITVNSSGTFTVTVSDVNGCTGTSVPVTTVVNPLPTATFSGTTSQTVCSGTTATLTVTLTGSGNYTVTYQVTNGATVTATTVTVTGNTMTITAPPSNAAGTYTYTVTNIIDGNGCSNAGTGSTTVRVLPNPTLIRTSAAGTDSQTICIGSAITPITYTYSGATSVSLNPVPFGLAYTAVGGVVTITGAPFPAGTYTLTLQASGACVLLSATITITVNPKPTATFAGTTSKTICSGSTATYTLTLTGTGNYTVTYQYTNGAAVTSTTVTVTGNTMTITVPPPTVAGTYTYTITNITDGNGCSNGSTTSATLRINPLPMATIAGNAIVCQFSSPAPKVTFTGAVGPPPYTFTYQINGGTSTTVTTSGGNVSVTVAQSTAVAGLYTYTLVSVSDGNGCSQAQTGTVTVMVVSQITGVLGTVNVSCFGGSNGSVNVVSLTGGMPPYTVSDDGVNFITPSGSGPTFQGLTFNGLTANIYNIYARDALGCTWPIGTATIIQPTKVTYNVVQGPPVTCATGTTSLTVNASGGAGTFTYSIDGGAQQISNVFITGIGNHTISITDAAGCVTSTTVNVTGTASLSYAYTGTVGNTCFNGISGQIGVRASGGVGNITYTLTKPGGSTSQLSAAQGTTVTFTGLSAGSYTVTATDGANCAAVTVLTVTQPAMSAPIQNTNGTPDLLLTSVINPPTGSFQTPASQVTITYTISVKNNGNISAQGVILRVTKPFSTFLIQLAPGSSALWTQTADNASFTEFTLNAGLEIACSGSQQAGIVIGRNGSTGTSAGVPIIASVRLGGANQDLNDFDNARASQFRMQ